MMRRIATGAVWCRITLKGRDENKPNGKRGLMKSFPYVIKVLCSE